MAIFSIATVITIPFIYVIVREPALRARKIDQANLVLILGTVLWVTSSIAVISRAYIFGGYDALGCNVLGVLTAIGTGWEVTGQALMSFDRYSIIVLEKDMSNIQFFCIFGISISIVVITSLVQLAPALQYAPHGGNTYCFFGFYNSDPKQFAVGMVAILTYIIGVTVMLEAYNLINLKVQDDAKEMASLKVVESVRQRESSSPAKTQKTALTRERVLYFRCLFILLTFIVSFGPEFAMFFYEAISQRRAPELVAQVVGLLAALNTIASPLVSIYCNIHYQRAILWHVFWFKYSTYTESQTAMDMKLDGLFRRA